MTSKHPASLFDPNHRSDNPDDDKKLGRFRAVLRVSF
jgi:hypothetical protein